MGTTFEIPTLRTDRLLMRAFRPGDIDAWASMEADPEVRRYRGNDPRTRDDVWGMMERALGQWALRGYGLFAVVRLEDEQFAGFAGILHPADWPEPELSYSLAQPFWGRGLATAAARTARDWVFAERGLKRLASFIMPENTRSIRVAEKLGTIRESMLTLRGFEAQWWVHFSPGHGPIV
jgi:RimJ/RimL family protein N-acetyltransferase